MKKKVYSRRNCAADKLRFTPVVRSPHDEYGEEAMELCGSIERRRFRRSEDVAAEDSNPLIALIAAEEQARAEAREAEVSAAAPLVGGIEDEGTSDDLDGEASDGGDDSEGLDQEEIAALRKQRVDQLIDLRVCGSRKEAEVRHHLRVLHVEGCTNIDEGKAKIMARVLKSIRRQKQKLVAKAIAKQNRRRAQALKRTVGYDDRVAQVATRSRAISAHMQTSRELQEAEEELVAAQKRYEQAFAAHEQAEEAVRKLKGSPDNIPAARAWVEKNYPTPEEQGQAYLKWYDETVSPYHEYQARYIA